MIPVLDVYTNLHDIEKETKVGTCRFGLRRGRVSCVFSYSDSYIAAPGSYAIDPALPLRSAAYHCNGLPGAIRDSAPDRWGRHLVDRKNIALDGEASRPLRTLDEVDYLIGVCDEARQGSLRYALPGSNAFVSSDGDVPPVVELKRLLAASNEIARGKDGIDQVKTLLDAGSGSLGGARPKASVVDEGKILLAKFPHPGDEWDVMAWEKTALDVMELARVEVPRSRLVRIGSSNILLVERFDRAGSEQAGLRIPYASAMTLVGACDGDACDYVDVADAMAQWSCSPAADMADLFRRVVLSAALNNTDDHLRNLGFVRSDAGWRLAPAFDININPDGSRRRATSVFGETGRGVFAVLPEFAEACGVSGEAAAKVISEVLAATGQWRIIARRNGCKESECSLMGRTIDACSALLSDVGF